MVQITQISEMDYINFLVAATCDVSCVKAADCYSDMGMVVSHDKFNRFLTRQSLAPEALWDEVAPFVEKRNGWLILDDTVIDKIYSKHIELTHFQWSGKHHKVVNGIGLVTLVWTDGTNTFPVDYRIYDKEGMIYRKMTIFELCYRRRLNAGFNLMSSYLIAGTRVLII